MFKMKKRLYSIITISTAVSVLYFSCSKDINERTENVPALQPQSLDLTAGAWKTVLLSRPDSFTVAAPPLTNSSPYLADLNEIKAYQQNLSSDQ